MKIVKKDNKVYKITESFYDTIKNDVEEITSFKQFLKETEDEQNGAMNNQVMNTTGNVQNGTTIDQEMDTIKKYSQYLLEIEKSKNQLFMRDYRYTMDAFSYALKIIENHYIEFGLKDKGYSFYNDGIDVLKKMKTLDKFLQNPVVFVYGYDLDFKRDIVPSIKVWLTTAANYNAEKVSKMSTKQMFMQAGNEVIKIVAMLVNSIMSSLYTLLYEVSDPQINGTDDKDVNNLITRFKEIHQQFEEVHLLNVDGAFKLKSSTVSKDDKTEKEKDALKNIKRKRLGKNEFDNPFKAAYSLKTDILVKTIEALDNVGLVEGVHYIIGFNDSSSFNTKSRDVIKQMQQRVPFLFKPIATLTRKIVSDEDLVSLMADYNNNLDRLPVLINEYGLNINTLIKETFKSSFVIYGMSDKIVNDINTAILADEGLSKFRYEVTYSPKGDVKGNELAYGSRNDKQYITFNFNRKYIRRPFGVPTFFFNVSATVPMPQTDEDGMPARITIPVAIIGITTFYGIFRKWLPTSALKKLGNTIKNILTIKK